MRMSLKHFHTEGSPAPLKIDRVYWRRGEGRVGEVEGSDAAGLLVFARACVCVYAHTQPYGSSHVLPFKGTPRQTKRSVRVHLINASGALIVSGCLCGGGDRKSLPATLCLFIYLSSATVMRSEHNFYTESPVM